MSVQNFIQAVVEEKEGFALDEPWRLNEESLSVIVPVKRTIEEKRDYITLAEAKNIAISDTGQIDYVFVKNNEDVPLLISRGELFRGKTQERAAIHGHVIMAGKSSRVAVRCIHKSKGINTGAEMKYGGKTPYGVDLSSQQKAWYSVNVVSTQYFTNSGQDIHRTPERRCYPGSIDRTLFSKSIDSNAMGMPDVMGVSDVLSCGITGSAEATFTTGSSGAAFTASNIGAADDLVGTLDSMSDMIKEMLKKIPPIENQVGAVFIYENSIKGLDIYNLPDSWKAIKDDVIEKEGSDYIKKEDNNLFELKPEKVRALLGKKLNVTFEEKVIHEDKDYKIIEVREVSDLKKPRLIGEAVEFNNKVIHLTMYMS
jgi:hypothetical protein